MDYTSIVFQIIVAWVYGHFLEYLAHRFYLHGRYSVTKKAFASHFRNHHTSSRKNRMEDPKYSYLHIDLYNDFEQKTLFFTAVIHAPIAFISPYAYGTLVFSTISYFIVHHLSHRRPIWGRRYVPWHYAHHLGADQHKNWGVRLPIFDYLFGTHAKYVGTEKETRDILNYVLKQSHQRESSAIRPCSNSSKRY